LTFIGYKLHDGNDKHCDSTILGTIDMIAILYEDADPRRELKGTIK